MDKNIRGCLVTGYQTLIPGLQLPDLDDRHVLAAAIKAQAELIITRNTRDFPPDALEPYGVKTQGPDDFIMDLLELNKTLVLTTMENHRKLLQRPQLTATDYCQHLERQELWQTATYLRSAWGLG